MLSLYTPEEVGNMLKVSARTVRNWCWQGKLRYRVRRSFKSGMLRRQILILEADLKTYIDHYLPPRN